MKIIFYGTRGGIIARSKKHYRHAITMIIYRGKRLLIDCGKDWLHKITTLKPDAILITHAHSDHVDGLKKGAPCPVFATDQSWELMHNFPITCRGLIEPRVPLTICGLIIEAFSLEHSIHAPAVGYRITSSYGQRSKSIFYVPDLVSIHDQKEALKNVRLYIGDGAIITRNLLVRKKNEHLTGHVSISEQLSWCKKEKVPCAIFTHCGSEITKATDEKTDAKIDALSKKFGVQVSIAYDGLEISL